MKLQPRSEYNTWVHRFGIVSSLILLALMLGFPLAASQIHGIWPPLKLLWPGFVMVLLFVAPYWPAETIGYMPVMGPGGIYLSYITGNVTNLRMPATVGTINILGLEPNTDECHTMAIIACGASVLTTIGIILLGLGIAQPLAPILQHPVIQPAYDYVIPALFGGLVAQGVLKSKRDFGLYFLPLAINLYFCFFTNLSHAYYMLIGLVSAIFLAVILYRRDKANASTVAKG